MAVWTSTDRRWDKLALDALSRTDDKVPLAPIEAPQILREASRNADVWRLGCRADAVRIESHSAGR